MPQADLCSDDVSVYLNNLLSASVTSLKTKNAAILLLTTIVDKNVDGQVLAGNHCLCSLCELFSLATLNGGTELDWIDNIDGRCCHTSYERCVLASRILMMMRISRYVHV